MKEQFYSYIQNLQDQITAKLEEVDGKAKFVKMVYENAACLEILTP